MLTPGVSVQPHLSRGALSLVSGFLIFPFVSSHFHEQAFRPQTFMELLILSYVIVTLRLVLWLTSQEAQLHLLSLPTNPSNSTWVVDRFPPHGLTPGGVAASPGVLVEASSPTLLLTSAMRCGCLCQTLPDLFHEAWLPLRVSLWKPSLPHSS